jgi:hypothetical protein
MALYHASFQSLDSLKNALVGMNPTVKTVGSINGQPAAAYGKFNNVALTFTSDIDRLKDDPNVMIKQRPKPGLHTFFVSKKYQIVPYEQAADAALKAIEDKYGFTAKAAYAQFAPGRVQMLFDYDNQIRFDVKQADLIPFEEAVKNKGILDYAVPNSQEKGGERYTTGLYLDIGFNGRNGIMAYPSWMRVICANLMIEVKRLVKTATIKHLGKKILEAISMEIEQSTEMLTGQYKNVVEFAAFMHLIEKFYGKKALQYVTDLDFREDVRKEFKAYYALQVITMLNRGISSRNISGYGLGIKTTASFKQLNKIALAA